MVVVVIVVKFVLFHSVYISPWQICTITEEDNALWELTCNDGRSAYFRSTLLKCILGDGRDRSGCDGGVCGGEITCNDGRSAYCRNTLLKCILDDGGGSSGCEGGVSFDSGGDDSFAGGCDSCGMV